MKNLTLVNKPSSANSQSSSATTNKFKLYREKRQKYSHNQYYSRQSRFYGGRNWQHPRYAYRSYPSFGMFDALFLWWMLGNIGNNAEAAEFAHNNQENPDLQEFLGEAQNLAGEYPEVAGNLALFENKMESLKDQPINPDYVPENLDPAIMLASAVAIADSQSPILNVGTGGVSGNYFAFCNGVNNVGGLKQNVIQSFTVTCNNTDGSVENILGMKDGKFDAILVQSDVVNRWVTEQPDSAKKIMDGKSVTLYPEFIHMIANEAASIDSVKDLDPAIHNIYLLGSGAQMSWEGLGRQDSFYSNFRRISSVESSETSLSQIAADPNGVGIYVSGLKNKILQTANDQFGDQLSIVLVDDWDFNNAVDANGNSIYMFANIPSQTYPKLQDTGFFGMTKDIETLTVRAQFVVSKDWLERYDLNTQKQLEKAVLESLPFIERKVGM